MYQKLTERQQDWIDALRSGEYKQGKGYLHTRQDGVDYHCCLGVACVRATCLHGLPLKVVVDLEDSAIEYNGTGALLPLEVAKWLGLRDEATRNPGNGLLNRDVETDITIVLGFIRRDHPSDWVAIAALNDAGFTFPQIADMLEYFADQVFIPEN